MKVNKRTEVTGVSTYKRSAERITERMQEHINEDQKIDYYLRLWNIAIDAVPPHTQEHIMVIVERIDKIAQKPPKEAEELFSELIKHGMIEEIIIDDFYRLSLTINRT